ncbi:hypothetical protein SDC9_106114 [bioreactor metagenome]|uniref:Uncharacterized protein n=1 Tax=bioreactor metagenome TaxID=1076179 RepID=A0A645BC32_9ZZZZ
MPFKAPPFKIGRGVLAQSLGHGLRHVAVGFKAALADAGPDGRHQPLYFRAVQPGQLPDRLFKDAQRAAPPSGMDRAHAA